MCRPHVYRHHIIFGRLDTMGHHLSSAVHNKLTLLFQPLFITVNGLTGNILMQSSDLDMHNLI